jgi:nucleoid DNA-binding protein
MTKSQLIERVASRTRHTSKRDIAIVVDAQLRSRTFWPPGVAVATP